VSLVNICITRPAPSVPKCLDQYQCLDTLAPVPMSYVQLQTDPKCLGSEVSVHPFQLNIYLWVADKLPDRVPG